MSFLLSQKGSLVMKNKSGRGQQRKANKKATGKKVEETIGRGARVEEELIQLKDAKGNEEGAFVSDKCFICDQRAVERCEAYPQVAYCGAGERDASRVGRLLLLTCRG